MPVDAWPYRLIASCRRIIARDKRRTLIAAQIGEMAAFSMTALSASLRQSAAYFIAAAGGWLPMTRRALECRSSK